jgi:hypothetical protein
MTNEEYFEKVSAYIHSIEQRIEETKQLAAGIIGENLLSLDLCFCGLMDRSVRLAQGFLPMLKSRNLTCAGALLRLQLDNCLRLYAIYIAEDEQAVVDCLLEGNSIGKLCDKSGKKMSDAYLKEQLGQYDKRLPIVYDNASGFIHFSSKAMYQSIYECKDNAIRFQVGGELHEKRNKVLLECAAAYLHYFDLFLNLLIVEADWKKEFDKSQEAGQCPSETSS